MKNKRSHHPRYYGCLLALELISRFHYEGTAGFVSRLHIRLNTSWAAAQPGPLGELATEGGRAPTSFQAEKLKLQDCLLNHSKRHVLQKYIIYIYKYNVLLYSIYWCTDLFVLLITSLTLFSVLFLKTFSASALWPLCLLQHFSIPFTLHNPHYPFLSLSDCLCASPSFLSP